MERISDILKREVNYQTEKPATHQPPTTPGSKLSLPKPKTINDFIYEGSKTLVKDWIRVDPNHTFEAIQKSKGMAAAQSAIRSVIDGERPIVLIYGGVGNGKTHLLEATAIELFQTHGWQIIVRTFPDVLGALRKAIGREPSNYQEMLDRYRFGKSPLIIDDIGSAGSDNDFGNRILEDIVCSRYQDRLPTFMTTNHDLQQLPERVLSRLQDKSRCYLVQNTAPDYRPQMVAK